MMLLMFSFVSRTACGKVSASLDVSLVSTSHNSGVRPEPAFVLVFSDSVEEELSIVWMVHLNIHPELVAGHVVRDDRETFRERRIHPIHINVHCEFVSDRMIECRKRVGHERCSSSFWSKVILSMLPIFSVRCAIV